MKVTYQIAGMALLGVTEAFKQTTEAPENAQYITTAEEKLLEAQLMAEEDAAELGDSTESMAAHQGMVPDIYMM